MAVVADAPRCVTSLTGGDEAWRSAIAKLDASLGSECRKVDVQVNGKSAVVIFVALDGRVAVRTIASVDELEPTVDALRVSLPAEPEPAAPPPVSVPPASKTVELVAAQPPVAPSSSPRLALSLYGGARAAWPGSFVAPILGASGTLGFGDWSLGIYGEWETSYSSRSVSLPPGFQLFAVAGGFSFGRRFFDRALTAELRVGGAVVTEEGSEADEVAGDDRAEARLGLHVRTSFPANSPVRGRIGFGIEVSPTVLSRSKRSIDGNLPAPPVWALVLTVGFEGDAFGSP